jgi:hypothetical protein
LRPVAWILVVVGLALAACGPSDPMQSREAKECRQLLAIEQGWGDVGAEAEQRVEAAKKRNADDFNIRHGYNKGNENVFAEIESITAERDRAVAHCVLRMKGGL